MVRTDEFPLPPSPFIRAALKTTVERIALELNKPQPRAPEWSEFEWRVAMAVAVMHGVSGLLAGRLQWHGPESWQTFLAEQLHQGQLRQQRTRELLDVIDVAAVQAQLPLMALKGSALLNLGLYAPGERPMSDIDLLCRVSDFEATEQLIEATGYEAGAAIWKHREYAPTGIGKERAFGEHIRNPIKIELHDHIAERLPLRETAITEQLFPREAQAGLNAYPSLTALMRHLLLHAAGNVCMQGIRLIHLHDIAALAGRLHAEDWNELLQPGDRWMGPPLAFTDHCFPGRIPQKQLGLALQQCAPLLRRASVRYRLDKHSISRWSMPRLPGLEWSDSMAEAGRCIATRFYPGRQALAQDKESALRQIQLTTTGWAQTPRWQKAFRVLAGRASHPMTLYSLQRALGYRPDSPAHIAPMRAAL